MGDSTAISQGSQYNDGFAVASINHLAKKFQVTSTNTGTSGATVTDVLANQIPTVTDIHPTIVLLSIGANDATHFTKGTVIRDTMQRIIDALKQSNHDVAIIITGSPAMDSVTRFPIGSKQLMGLRTRRLNAIFDELARKNDLIFAPIAEKTRDAFIADPTLTASDQFHPNKRGYALWIPVINAALDAAIKR
jgi:lysophospholipase L1-like esterase